MCIRCWGRTPSCGKGSDPSPDTQPGNRADAVRIEAGQLGERPAGDAEHRQVLEQRPVHRELRIAERLAVEYPETNRGVGTVVVSYPDALLPSELGAMSWVMLAGVFGVAYSLRFVHDTFFGPGPHDLDRVPHEPPRWMKVPVELLVVICIAVGVAPALTVAPVLHAAAASILGNAMPEYSLAVWHGFNLPLTMSAIGVVGGVRLRVARASAAAHRKPVAKRREDEDGEVLFVVECDVGLTDAGDGVGRTSAYVFDDDGTGVVCRGEDE